MLAGCLGLLMAAFGASAAKPVTIKDVRLWAGPDGTRLVFDLSGPAEHSVLTLDNPDRVVVATFPAASIESERVLPARARLREATARGGSAQWRPACGRRSHWPGAAQDFSASVPSNRMVIDWCSTSRPSKGTVAAAPVQRLGREGRR